MKEERAHEVVEHLQAAALELIAAARAALDLAEELVKDPTDVVVLASALASRVAAPGPPRAPASSTAAGDGGSARVQRIRVS